MTATLHRAPALPRIAPTMSRPALALFLAAAACGASAQEVTLKAVSAFQEGTYFARSFEAFVKRVNAEGKGVVQINYLGGPKAMAVTEHGSALRRGVVDLASTTVSYTSNLVPEGLALSFTSTPMATLRKNGGLAYLNGLYEEKGMHYLGRTAEGIPNHVFTNKKIDKADLTGQKLRVAAIHRDFFQSLGATVVQTAPGEVYAALERGVVDGFGFPLLGIFDFGWQQKVKYRIDPGFYSVEVGTVVSLAAWSKLTPAQKAFLEKQAMATETENVALVKADIDAELKKHREAGIETVALEGAARAQYAKAASNAAWEGLIKLSPKHGPKLRELMGGE